jgi:hypothetical protein
MKTQASIVVRSAIVIIRHLLLAAVLMIAAPWSMAQRQYQLTVIETSSPWQGVGATLVNDRGDLVLVKRVGATNGFEYRLASGEIIEIVAPAGERIYGIFALSNAGHAVGMLDSGDAFVWTPDGRWQAIKNTTPYRFLQPSSVNDAAEVVGVAGNRRSQFSYRDRHSFRWTAEDGVTVIMNQSNSAAVAINNERQVAAIAYAEGPVHTCINGVLIERDGSHQRMGGLRQEPGCVRSQPVDMNGQGAVLVYWFDFRKTGAGIWTKDGGIDDLGVGNYLSLAAINDRNEVLGSTWVWNRADGRVPLDSDVLVPGSPKISQFGARAINNSGVIVGEGNAEGYRSRRRSC